MRKTQEKIENFFQKSLEESRLRHMTITKKLALLMISWYPALKNDRALRYLFVYLLSGRVVRDKETGHIIIPCWLLAQFAGKQQRYYRTELLLKKFGELFPDFTYVDYCYQNHKCRRVIFTGIPDVFKEMFEDHAGERVYVKDLKAQTYRNRLSKLHEDRKEALAYNYTCDDARTIAQYHLSHTLPDFMEMLDKYFDEVWNEALQSPEKDYHLRVLQEIWDSPIPLYFPSRKSKTPRIFSNGLQYLGRKLRRKLCRDWIELDLISCQTSIVAMLCDINSLKEVLRAKISLWKLLLEYMNIPEEKWDIAKYLIKQAVYSIIFGKQGFAVEKDLEDQFKEQGIAFTGRLINHPLMQDLLQAITKLKKDMIQAGGWQSAYGWLVIDKEEDMDSFISRVVQSYELKLIYPCYEVAIREKDSGNQTFKIMLHQHDGISIKVLQSASKAEVLAKLIKAVEKVASELGIITTLAEA